MDITLDKNKAFTFTLDKDHDPAKHPDFRYFRATRELIERIVEAENAAFMNEIRANTVVVNGRKYGMLKGHPGYIPTVFGMRLETREDMPDDWDFFLQQRPPVRPTNGDRIRAMSDEELAGYLANICYDLWSMFVADPKKMWLDWLKSPVEVDE